MEKINENNTMYSFFSAFLDALCINCTFYPWLVLLFGYSANEKNHKTSLYIALAFPAFSRLHWAELYGI
jgi:hypothetical protein